MLITNLNNHFKNSAPDNIIVFPPSVMITISVCKLTIGYLPLVLVFGINKGKVQESLIRLL